MNPRALPCIVLLLLIVVLGGCAVTSGSTFGSVVASITAGSRDDSIDDPGSSAGDTAPEEGAVRLRVITEPEDATVFIDGRRQGRTPIDLSEIEPGTYLLAVEKDGYYEVRRRIEVPAAGSLVVEIRLERITGFLDVEVRPRQADIYVGSTLLIGGFAELPRGAHRVRVELFGYRSETRDVQIYEQQLTRLSIEMEPAPFEVGGLSAWRRSFNPANPGLVGTTAVTYRVSAPGSGRLVIRDEAGTPVRTIDQGPYATWDQEYRWDGADDAGRTVADGSYTIEIEAVGDDGRFDGTAATVSVDSTLVVRFRSIWSANAGLLYAPVRGALPAGQVQVSSQIAGMIAPVGDALVARFPGRLGARVGLGSGFELSGYGGAVFHSEPIRDRFSFGGALSWDGVSAGAGDIDFGAGITAGGIYQSGAPDGRLASPDTQASYPGFFASLPLSLRAGGVGLVLAPEFRLTVAPVVYGVETLPANAWGAIGYLRGGVVADLDRLTLGLSAAGRTRRFDEGLALDLPFQVGAELHWIVPGSSVALTAFVVSEVESTVDFYIMSGLGIGVLF